MPSNPDDVYDLERFVTAQASDFATALDELRGGRKRSHWMWYIFPQVAGLGSSAMAERYSLRSRREAAAYLAHPVLGPRLLQCVDALLQIKEASATAIMGVPDDLKLRSSMTLFAAVSPPGSPFQSVLDRYFAGRPDAKTVAYLGAHA